jgi:hypothetical protein
VSNDYNNLVGNTDAQQWAEAFMHMSRHHTGWMTLDLLLGWFANAIMAGYDEGYERGKQEAAVS